MTTTAPSSAGSPAPAFPGVRPGVVSVSVTGLVIALAAAIVAREPGPQVYGALTGLALVLGFFGFGSVVVKAVVRLAPKASLLVALTTYTLQVMLLALVYVGLVRSGLLGARVDPLWLSLTVISGALAWSVSLVIGSLRWRQPIYDLPEAKTRDSRMEVQVR